MSAAPAARIPTVVPVPDDAPLMRRLLGLTGRDPG